jgi:molybdenum cofactor guanylyltransferase
MSRAGFLIAGGKSSRMGTNKAFVEFGGQTLLIRALSALTAACGNATIVGDAATFADVGPNLEDAMPGCGPLGGIHAALSHSKAQLNLMLAVDMPFVSAELLEFLMEVAGGSDAVVTVPRTGARYQPLCAVYRPDFLFFADQALRAGRYRIDEIFVLAPIRVVEEAELRAAGFSERHFFNINTPEDRHIAQSFDFES